MHDFVSHVLRKYYAQTDWNPYNSYLHLTSSSQAILDFAIPTGLSLSISASPSPPFFTTYRLRALPQLSGALGYIFASVEDDDGNAKGINIGGNSKDIRFKDVIERFRIIETPWKPTGKEQVFQAGRRVDTRDYLLYGCMHVPSSRVDALFTTRLSPTWQLLMTAISMPPRNSRPSLVISGDKSSDGNTTSSTSSQAASVGTFTPGTTNLQFNLQRDSGRWFTEYSYSFDDGLLGLRALHNLGHVGSQNEALNANGSVVPEERLNEEKRVDEESTLESVVGGGLQGRFSVGAEVFFSPLEKSAGLSTGVRFTTLPENVTLPTLTGFMNNPTSGLMTDLQHQPSQPPTTITATLNPMMGHLSTAYAARMTRDIVACSRFDFNVYSYDSDFTLGAEYWLHSSPPNSNALGEEAAVKKAKNSFEEDEKTKPPSTTGATAADRQLQAREDSGLSVREGSPGSHVTSKREEKIWSLRDEGVEVEGSNNALHSIDNGVSPSQEVATAAPTLLHSATSTFGVIKGRLSTSGNVALLWEGRLRNCLVSFGIKADLSSTQGMANLSARKPLIGVGLDIIYFTQARQEGAPSHNLGGS
jgi:distribution and morphology protein 10